MSRTQVVRLPANLLADGQTTIGGAADRSLKLYLRVCWAFFEYYPLLVCWSEKRRRRLSGLMKKVPEPST